MSITTEVKILDILDHVGGYGRGQTILFEHQGKKLRYESWATGESCGTDFYDMEGRPVGAEAFRDSDAEIELGEFFDKVLEIYQVKYEEWVNPAIETAVQSTLFEVRRRQS